MREEGGREGAREGGREGGGEGGGKAVGRRGGREGRKQGKMEGGKLQYCIATIEWGRDSDILNGAYLEVEQTYLLHLLEGGDNPLLICQFLHTSLQPV